jgi:hypothetical protein
LPADKNMTFSGGVKLKVIMIACMVLAFIAAVFYELLGAHIITAASLTGTPATQIIIFVAGGCYILGGLLILLKKRWLWIVGLVMNTLVLVVFFTMYSQNPAVIFSLPGLGTKIPQVLLEAGLIYLIITYHRKK